LCLYLWGTSGRGTFLIIQKRPRMAKKYVGVVVARQITLEAKR